MEQLINEIRGYAAGRNIKPSTVLQRAGGLSGKVWATWEAGTASCTLTMANRIRAYIVANPVPQTEVTAPAEVDFQSKRIA